MAFIPDSPDYLENLSCCCLRFLECSPVSHARWNVLFHTVGLRDQLVVDANFDVAAPSEAHCALLLSCAISGARCPTGLGQGRTSGHPVVFPCPVHCAVSDVSKNVPASPDVHRVELRSLAREHRSPPYASLSDGPTVGSMFPLSLGGAQLFGSSWLTCLCE